MFDTIIVDVGTNTQKLKEKFPHAKVVKYDIDILKIVDSQIDAIATSHFWILYGWCDYTGFDFTWEPEWHQDKQIHVWPSNGQQRGGYTVLIPKREFINQRCSFDSLQDFNPVCWHDTQIPSENCFDVFIMNVGGNDDNLIQLTTQLDNSRVLRYTNSHLGMVMRALTHAKTPYIWLIGDCCSYDTFDFSYKPNWENKNQIHCWASGDQPFGDTFLIPVEIAKAQINDLEKLEYFESIKWIDAGVPRLPWPINIINNQDLFSAVSNHRFSSIYEWFICADSIDITHNPCLWEKRHLIAFNKTGHVSLIPRDAKTAIKTKLLDYDYILYEINENIRYKPQDIVFISYDEENAKENWKKLKSKYKNAIWVNGVKGLVTSYKVAAEKSTTPWFFAVFSKNEIVDEFNFDFIPNMLDEPGHYVFRSINCLNNLSYGHGGVKLYHSDLVYKAEKWDYDFTMSFSYTNIPIVSNYYDAATPFEAWRSSFREVLKLKQMNTIESKYRLHMWKQPTDHPLSYYSIRGATFGLMYTGEINANDWEWLLEKFIQDTN